jgi:hypothetical protein
MPTKDELIAFASEVGVDVPASATKADIEAALTDAGYDPVTLQEEDDMTESTGPEPDAQDPNEVGYAGVVPDEIENDAYTVQGQGKDTAKRERAQVAKLRAERYAAPEEDA